MVTHMWHRDFKIYDNDSLPDLPQAPLPQQPHHTVGHKSSSVSDFVSRMGQPVTLVEQALRLSAHKEEETPEFSQMTTKYGISVDTLRLIKQKQMLQEAQKADIKA